MFGVSKRTVERRMAESQLTKFNLSRYTDKEDDMLDSFVYRGQLKAGTGHIMLFVPFVFSMSRFQGPAFRCYKIVVIVTLLEAIEGISDKDDNLLGERQVPQSLRETTS